MNLCRIPPLFKFVSGAPGGRHLGFSNVQIFFTFELNTENKVVSI